MIPCPFCGEPDLFRIILTAQWGCLACERQWIGRWHNITQRWTIRVPVESVPWASGTKADLECWRRFSGPDFSVAGEREPSAMYFLECCRWPKSCSAFDPGFTVGKGPTTLPVVWFDGFGWRSGPPEDLERMNPLIAKRVRELWDEVKPREEVNDDDRSCGQGCEYICRCH